MCLMCGSRIFRGQGGGGGPDNVFFIIIILAINVFHREDRMNLHREAIGPYPRGPMAFRRRSKNCCFSGGGGPDPSYPSTHCES